MDMDSIKAAVRARAVALSQSNARQIEESVRVAPGLLAECWRKWVGNGVGIRYVLVADFKTPTVFHLRGTVINGVAVDDEE